MNHIQQSVLNFLPAKKKKTPSGWISFNAPCCVHNGETADTRSRGGVILNDNGVSYHCFNCNYKTGWNPGWHITYKFRKLLKWLNVDEAEIQRLALEALKLRDEVEQIGFDLESFQPEFDTIDIPDSVKITDYRQDSGFNFPDDFVECYNYIKKRKLDNAMFYWTPDTTAKFNRRIILPFIYNSQPVGYTARIIDDNSVPKYFTRSQPGFVFNMDKQSPARKFVLVTEGPFDAICIDGIAVLSNNINEQQVDLIDQLGKQVVLVPDKDASGKQMIEQAVEYGWSVSFPEWHDTCKDVNQSVIEYGQLFTFKSIIDNIETNPIKIKVKMKKF